MQTTSQQVVGDVEHQLPHPATVHAHESRSENEERADHDATAHTYDHEHPSGVVG